VEWKAAGQLTEIWILDHTCNLWGCVLCTIEEDKLHKHSNAVAWQGYAGTPDMMSKFHDAYPDVEMHWTEGGPRLHRSRLSHRLCKWGGLSAQYWCPSITAWNLAGDEHGRPNIGPFPCSGVVTIKSQNEEITRSGQYWALIHYSRVIRRGARRSTPRAGPPACNT
jgi:glucosylceramidase